MKTKNNQQKSDAVFLKYGTVGKGQHLMSVLQRMPDGTKKIIAKIFRDWSQEDKRYNYIAKDNSGKEVFTPTPNLWELEKQFTEKIASEKSLVEKNIPDIKQEEPVKEKTPREKELKEVRGKNTDRENEKSVTR